MPTIPADLLPFYGLDCPFAVDLVRQGGLEPVPFRGIVSEADAEAMQGYIVGAAVEIRWPTAAATLKEGDQVDQVRRDAATGAILETLRTFRVARDGRRVLDGLESLTYLTEI
jgi:hypothetical protein